MPQKINISNVIAVSLSVANTVIVLPVLLVITDYYVMFTTHTTFRLQFHSVLLDIAGVALSAFVCAYSVLVIIHYFQHKPVKPFLPILFFVLYLSFIIASAVNFY